MIPNTWLCGLVKTALTGIFTSLLLWIQKPLIIQFGGLELSHPIEEDATRLTGSMKYMPVNSTSLMVATTSVSSSVVVSMPSGTSMSGSTTLPGTLGLVDSEQTLHLWSESTFKH